MKEERVLVIIPAYNEAENIERVVRQLSVECPTYDYVVVNDGSRDRTLDICKKKNLNYLNLPHNLGIGGAVQAGYKYALYYNYDIAIQFDGDGQHDAIYLPEGVKVLKMGYDMVVGSRFVQKSDGFQSSITRRCGIKFLSQCIYMLSGKRVYDVTSGLRFCNRKMMEFFADNYDQDYPEPQAILSAVLSGYTVREYPVNMRERIGGASSIKKWNTIRYMILVSLSLLLTWNTRKMRNT